MENSITNSKYLISSEDTDEECVIHLGGENMEIVIYDKAYEFIQELPQSFLSRYQTSLEVSMKGSDYKCQNKSKTWQII